MTKKKVKNQTKKFSNRKAFFNLILTHAPARILRLFPLLSSLSKLLGDAGKDAEINLRCLLMMPLHCCGFVSGRKNINYVNEVRSRQNEETTNCQIKISLRLLSAFDVSVVSHAAATQPAPRKVQAWEPPSIVSVVIEQRIFKSWNGNATLVERTIISVEISAWATFQDLQVDLRRRRNMKSSPAKHYLLHKEENLLDLLDKWKENHKCCK